MLETLRVGDERSRICISWSGMNDKRSENAWTKRHLDVGCTRVAIILAWQLCKRRIAANSTGICIYSVANDMTGKGG